MSGAFLLQCDTETNLMKFWAENSERVKCGLRGFSSDLLISGLITAPLLNLWMALGTADSGKGNAI